MSELPTMIRQCAFCGDPFTPNTGKQIYDTADCRYRAARQAAYDKRQADKAAREAAVLAADNAQ